MFEIYSIGDAAYLAAVLNAVAMLMGTGHMSQLAGVGFLIGVILVTFQGLVQARAPQYQQMLIALVIYLGMFGPSARVSVEDLYSGAVHRVDNVPLGVAAVGSALSQVGYGVTRLFEQAFSTPAMTDYGFAAPLQILQSVRAGTLSRARLGAANSPTPGADIERSFVNYIAECVLYDVDTGQRSLDSVLRDPSWTGALAVANPMPTTELWLGGAPVVKACDDAWADLSAYTTTEFLPALRGSLAATLAVQAGEVDNAVQTALDAVAGAGVDAQNYMVMSVAASVLPKGEAQVWEELGRWETAATITQAAQQRNTQWAAEETLFARIVRPMMTFFEAFLFAVSPLMVFAVGLGTIGIRMIGKYLLFGLWIQLWQPILAVINLYIILTTQGKLDALRNAGMGNLELPSIFALWKLDFILSDYLGVGGMLAASTPAISLMLIYGSAVTATHLAGRLQGGDHINEKIASPDAVNPAAALSMGSLKTHAPLTGTTTPNANSVLWSADVGRSMQDSVRSGEQAVQQASSRFSSALGAAASATASRSGESFDARSRGWEYAATGSATDKTLLAEAESIASGYRQDEVSRSGIAATLAGGLSGGRNDQGRTGKASISGDLQRTYGVDKTIADSLAGEISRRVTGDAGFEARLAESIKLDEQTGRRNVFSQRLTDEESARLTRSADDVVSSSLSLERARSMESRYGAMGRFGASEIGHAIAQNPAMMTRVMQEIDRRNLAGDHRTLAGSWAYAKNMTADSAQAAAGIALLIGHADGATTRTFSPAEAQSAKEAGYGILGDLFGTHRPGPNSDPNRHAGLAEEAPSFGSARDTFERAGVSDPSEQVAGLRGEIDAHGRIAGSVDDPSAVAQFHDRSRDGVASRREEHEAEVRAQNRDRLGALIDRQAILPRSAARTLHNEVGGILIKAAEVGTLTAAGAGGSLDRTVAAAKAFGSTLAGGGGVADAVSAGKAAAGGEAGWTKAVDTIVAARMQEVAGFGLTSAQHELFRESTGSVFADLPGQAQQAARAAVVAEAGGGARGEHIAELIERAAVSREDTDLRLIGNYNSHGAATEKKTEQSGLELHRTPTPTETPTRLSAGAGTGAATSTVGGAAGGVLDIIASAESGGNYNAWYGNAGQNTVDLSTLTLDRIRDLQKDLVKTRGGSPIGRYQILDDTLDRLAVRMGLSGSEPFTPELQDRMGLLLMRDAGFNAWQRGTIDDAAFNYRLSKVWAGLPMDASNQSYYEGKAGNRATVDYDVVMDGLRRLKGSGAGERGS